MSQGVILDVLRNLISGNFDMIINAMYTEILLWTQWREMCGGLSIESLQQHRTSRAVQGSTFPAYLAIAIVVVVAGIKEAISPSWTMCSILTFAIALLLLAMPPMLDLLSSALLLTIVYLFIRHLWVSRDTMASIPGPSLARWTPFWLAYHARIGDRYLAVHEVHKKYGPLVCISPSHVSVALPEAIPIIYGHGARQGAYDKSVFYHAFVADSPSIFSTTSRTVHAQKRRIVSQAFSCNALLAFIPVIEENVRRFTDKLDSLTVPQASLRHQDTRIAGTAAGDMKNGEEKATVDLLTWLNYLTFDVLSDLAFGEPIGMIANGNDIVSVQEPDGTIKTENAISLVDGREHLSAVVGIHPILPLLSRLLPDPFFVHGRQSSSGLANFARRNVMARVASGSGHRDDILDRLIEGRLKETEGGEMSQEQLTELVAETVTMLSAGSDTTASSVTAIVYLVKTHPQVYKKLTDELEARIAPADIPSHEIVKDLPYLRAVIEEGLRYYATMSTGLPRLVPEGGAVFGGQYIPAGTEVSIPAYTIQHDASIWGDPDVFRPERWLVSEEQHRHLHKYLLTFGKGPRACLGKNLAYMETQLMVATVFHRYDIELQSERLESTEGFVHKTLGLPTTLSLKSGRR